MVGDGQEIRSYRDLRVWREAMSLAVAAYKFSSSLPSDERFGLISQIRRAAASVPANIAEGYGRESEGAYVQLLRIGQGSLKELETHLLLTEAVDLTNSTAIEPLISQCDTVGRMLHGLIRSVE